MSLRSIHTPGQAATPTSSWRALAVAVLSLLFGWNIQGAQAAARGNAAEPTKSELDFFEKNIRPIFIEHCYSCHSHEADKVKGGFALDSREALLKGGEGGPVIVPGKPDSSRLVLAIRHTDAELKMPPKTPLNPEQIARIEQWVSAGAAYPKSRGAAAGSSVKSLTESRKQWPFTPLAAIPEPKVKFKEWPSQFLDRFVLAKLESIGLRPAAASEPLNWLRRVSFDLTGLPPALDEVERFQKKSPSAQELEQLVDKLLDSNRFGEKWGRHWLDIARYSDSNGLEANLDYPEAWRYRDYVIHSFNKDKPYGEFIREQLAGDLLRPGSLEQQLEALTATGFLMLGPKAMEESEKLRMDVVDEQIDVTMRGLQGLTVSCARCHDHKFDPISIRDYYALAGIFTSTTSLRTNGAPVPVALATPWLERPLDSEEKQKAFEDHERKIVELTGQIRAGMQLKKSLPGGVSSNQLDGILVDNAEAIATGSWRSSTGSTNRFIQKDYAQDGDREKGKKSLRFQPTLPVPGRYEVRLAYPPAWNRATNVPVRVEHMQGATNLRIDQRATPPIDQLFVSLGVFEFEGGTNGAVIVSNEGTRGFVVADAVQFLPEKAISMTAANNMRNPSPDRAPATMMSSNVDPFTLQEQLYELQDKSPPRPAMAMAVREGPVANTKIRLRGDIKRPGEEATRGIPPILIPNGMVAPAIPPGESGRLQLADWIASTNNPLTARVAVNRVWMHLFGNPLVGTPDNFGALGERPTHQELLDHLAVRFVQLGGSHKKLIREIVLSSTYRQSVVPSREALEKDPENLWVSRMPLRRLPAESIRDALLQASGKLSLEEGGPSLTAGLGGARPAPRPAMAASGSSNRRSVYLPIRRNNLDDLLQNFDFADPHALAAKRNRTSAPTQALYMLNSDFVHEMSQALAESLISLPSDSERLDHLFQRALSRRPTAEETSRSLAFLSRFNPAPKQEGDGGSGDRTLRSWRALVHALFASTEFRFLN